MERALAKAQVVLLLVILLIGAVGAYYIAQKELPKNSNPLTPTPTPSTSPAPTPTATPAPVNAGPLTVVSVSILQPYNPGGPTIEVILQNNATNPVVSLQAVLTLSGHNYTYVFDDVSSSNPLLPNQDASQTDTLIDAGFETNQTYPMEIIGTLQNGSTFDFITPVTITQNSITRGVRRKRQSRTHHDPRQNHVQFRRTCQPNFDHHQHQQSDNKLRRTQDWILIFKFTTTQTT